MKATNIFLFAIIALFLTACDKSDDVQPSAEATINDQHFIFGVYRGFCMGDCAELYKIEGDALYADSTDRFYPFSDPYGTIEFQPEALSQERYELAAELIEAVPQELLNSDEQTFGCPDCADQGGIYIEIKEGEDIQAWNIDYAEDNLPEFLVPFTQQVKAVIGDLRQ